MSWLFVALGFRARFFWIINCLIYLWRWSILQAEKGFNTFNFPFVFLCLAHFQKLERSCSYLSITGLVLLSMLLSLTWLLLQCILCHWKYMLELGVCVAWEEGACTGEGDQSDLILLLATLQTATTCCRAGHLRCFWVYRNQVGIKEDCLFFPLLFLGNAVSTSLTSLKCIPNPKWKLFDPHRLRNVCLIFFFISTYSLPTP